MTEKLPKVELKPTGENLAILQAFGRAKKMAALAEKLKPRALAIIQQCGKQVLEEGILSLSHSTETEIPTVEEWQGKIAKLEEKTVGMEKLVPPEAAKAQAKAKEWRVVLSGMREVLPELGRYWTLTTRTKDLKAWLVAAGAATTETKPTVTFRAKAEKADAKEDLKSMERDASALAAVLAKLPEALADEVTVRREGGAA